MIATMQYEAALVLAKIGHRIARAGWNGKGMFVFLIAGSGTAGGWTFTNGRCDNYPCLPFLAMKTATNEVVPWLASQTDLLANDWIDLDDGAGPL